MSSESTRLRVPRDLHQHQDPVAEAGGLVMAGSCCDEAAGQSGGERIGRLARRDGKLLYETPDGVSEPVRVVWARPLSGRGGPVSVMFAGKKRELAYLDSLDRFDAESRRLAEEELDAGMVLPRITAIRRVKPRFGNYYWDVETDKGAARFLLSSPENNSFRPRPDVLVVKDVSGNCYEINPVSGLDKTSLEELERVL